MPSHMENTPSFIEDYMHMVSGTEAPREYHFWCMLSTMSAFAGRRFWFPLGSMHFYTNLYVLLVGDPAMRKSSAMNIAKNVVRAAGICPVAATQITKEALTQKMSSTVDGTPKKNPFIGQHFFGEAKTEYNQYAIFATELVEFIAVNPQGFLDFLTTVWDEAILEVDTKNKGQDYIIGPYITLLGCLTPEKMKGYLKMSILTGGFARRTALVFSGHKDVIPIPEFTDSQRDAQARCVEYGKSLQSQHGQFDWTPELKTFYTDWYVENARTLTDRVPTVRSWFESKAEMLFKVSMLVSLAQDPTNRFLDIPHFKMALYATHLVEKNLERVFEGTGINPNAQAIAQVVRMLEALDKPMNRKILIGMFMDNVTNLRELEDSLTQLVSCGRLAERTLTVTGSGALLGTLIGSPTCMSRYSDIDLIPFLQRPTASPMAPAAGIDVAEPVYSPQPSTSLSPSANLAVVPSNPRVDSIVIRLREIETLLHEPGDAEAQ